MPMERKIYIKRHFKSGASSYAIILPKKIVEKVIEQVGEVKYWAVKLDEGGERVRIVIYPILEGDLDG